MKIDMELVYGNGNMGMGNGVFLSGSMDSHLSPVQEATVVRVATAREATSWRGLPARASSR